MNKVKLAVGIILVLFVGALGGALGTGIYFKQFTRRFEAGGPPMSERVQLLSKQFARELDLTQEQKEELEKIVQEHQEKIMDLSREVYPEIEKIDEESFALMKEKLTNGQKEKLDTLYEGVKEEKTRNYRGRYSNQSAPQTSNREPGPFYRNYEGFIDEMKERLDLSKEQEEKIRAIMEERAKELQKAMEKGEEGQEPTDSSSLKREMFDIEEELSGILTEEQMEEYRMFQDEGSFNNIPSPEVP